MTNEVTLVEISADDINSDFTELKNAILAKAELSGSTTQVFNVANAITSTQAINKGQLDASVTTISADIADLEEEVDTKADLNGSTTQVFNVANATSSTEAINKGQLDSALSTINDDISDLESELENLTLNFGFCMNSGNLTNGEADLLNYSGTALSFKIGGSYPNLVLTYADKSQEILTSLANITGLSTDGTYTILKEKNSATAVAVLSSAVTQGKTFESSPTNGDYHCLTATGLQTYKYVSGTFVETQYVPIGTVTVSGGVITSVLTNPYNQNGYDVNIYTIKQYKYDYANPVSKSTGTTYTADCDGILFVCRSSSYDVPVLTIDGTAYGVGWTSSQGSSGSDFVPIVKGQTYNFASGGVIKFIPQVTM